MALIVTLAASGLLLVLLELLLPGGILGFVGSALFLAVVILCFQEFGAAVGISVLLGLSIAGLALFSLWLRIFPSSPAGRFLMLKENVSGRSVPECGGVTPGSDGVALTALRPAGVVRVAGARYEAKLETGFADPGTPVRVVRCEGSALIVAKEVENEIVKAT